MHPRSSLPRRGALLTSQRHLALAGHAARVAASLGAFGLGTAFGSPLAVAAASVALHLALFGMSHDQMHGALGLGPRSGRLVLSISQVLMFGSGHGTQLTHRVHHARPLAADDTEGAGARRTLLGAAALAPLAAARHRLEGLRLARGATRRWVIGENVACAALLAACVASGVGPLQIFVAVAVCLQSSAAVWAAWLPHHAPEWLLAFARRLAHTPSLVLRSLAHHDVHHARPDLPAAWLRQPPDTEGAGLRQT
jgi:hypothetical protein